MNSRYDKSVEHQLAIGKTRIFLNKIPTCDLVDEYFDYLNSLPVSLQSLCFKEINWTQNKGHFQAAMSYRKQDFQTMSKACIEYIRKDVAKVVKLLYPNDRSVQEFGIAPKEDFKDILEAYYYLVD